MGYCFFWGGGGGRGEGGGVNTWKLWLVCLGFEELTPLWFILSLGGEGKLLQTVVSMS